MEQPDTFVKSDTAAQLTPQQIETIVDENGEAYRRDVWKTSWKTRSQGLFAGGIIGIVTGGGIGAVTVLSTLLVGVSLATLGAMFWPVVGAFAVYGMLGGIAALTAVGLSAGSVIGGAKVADRKKLLKNPTEELQEQITYHGVVQPKKTLWNRLTFTTGSSKVFTLRNTLVFGAVGLALGAFLVLTGGLGVVAGAAPFIASAMGIAAVPTAVINCMTIAACTSFGMIFGIDYPTITANMTEFVANTFSGKVFERSKGPAAELEKARATILPRSAQVKEPVVFKSGTTNTLGTPIGSYAGTAPAQHLRKLAEQKFNTMNSSKGAAIN